jgi:hypothetical protein
MPSSRPNPIPTVIHVIRQLQPRSILDVGVGFGKWGHLFREYTDILESENEPTRYRRENWRVRIDGIEVYEGYITPMHRYLYNEIHIGEAGRILGRLQAYDVIFLGDVLEHFDRPAGMAFLRLAVLKSNRAVIVLTPKYETGQEALCANEYERHRSLWCADDFKKLEGAQVTIVEDDTLLAVLVKPGVTWPALTPPRRPAPEVARQLKEAAAAIADSIPGGVPFILVDEEQIRSEMGRPEAIPFLERNGVYYGPPADDEAAIGECERLRKEGARYLVVIWSCFWWLEYYVELERHLRDRYACVREDDLIVVFALGEPG